jgi:hypothetical protein
LSGNVPGNSRAISLSEFFHSPALATFSRLQDDFFQNHLKQFCYLLYYLYTINHTIMKYAYLFGTSAFVVPSKVVSYSDGQEEKEFLRINSIHHDLAPPAEEPELNIDLHIRDTDGTPVLMLGNLISENLPYTEEKEKDSVKILRPDGSLLIHVHQIDDEAAMRLEHNIVAEFEVNMPLVVIRINGNFMLGDIHIDAENEKLFVNKAGYANSALAGANQVVFTKDGVVL